MKKCLRTEYGFSLVELMVAVTILAFMSIALNGLWTTAMLAKERAWHQSVATELAAGKLEELEAMPFTAIVNESEISFSGKFADYRRRCEVKTINGDEAATGLKQVTVEVWHVREPQSKVSFITYVRER